MRFAISCSPRVECSFFGSYSRCVGFFIQVRKYLLRAQRDRRREENLNVERKRLFLLPFAFSIFQFEISIKSPPASNPVYFMTTQTPAMYLKAVVGVEYVLEGGCLLVFTGWVGSSSEPCWVSERILLALSMSYGNGTIDDGLWFKKDKFRDEQA